MYRSLPVFLILLVGCGPTPQEEYDLALSILNKQQERLDALRPAYDAAQQKAAQMVCKEIAGVTPEESASAALGQLQDILGQTVDAQTPATQPADMTNVNDADAALDQLIAAQADFQEKQAAISEPIQKANEVMQQINTPGTPEHKRYEEVLEDMPEVKAYRRQEDRVERAQKLADAAEAAVNTATQ